MGQCLHDAPARPFTGHHPRLKRRHVCVTLPSLALVVAVSRRNDIRWDAVIACEMFVYKRRPGGDQRAAGLLQSSSGDILMIAWHNFDLDARTAKATALPLSHAPTNGSPPDRPTPI